MSKKQAKKFRRPVIPPAFAVKTPEGKTFLRGELPSMSDHELRSWSADQAGKSGIHQAAVEAAGRGVTLMAFDQKTNTSYPYRPDLVEKIVAEEERARMEAVELHGLHGEDLDDFIAQSSEARAA